MFHLFYDFLLSFFFPKLTLIPIFYFRFNVDRTLLIKVTEKPGRFCQSMFYFGRFSFVPFYKCFKFFSFYTRTLYFLLFVSRLILTDPYFSKSEENLGFGHSTFSFGCLSAVLFFLTSVFVSSFFFFHASVLAVMVHQILPECAPF